MTDAKSPEPSIEEILASIRKIISDDDGEPDPPPEKADSEVDSGGEDDILELTDVVFSTPPELEVEFEPVEPPSNVTVLPQPAPRAPEPRPAPPSARSATPVDSELLSNATIEAASGAFARLTHLESSEMGGAEPRSSGLTVEDLARELLKPMLRQWIDQNLPSIVERLVERELRKITRKAEDL